MDELLPKMLIYPYNRFVAGSRYSTSSRPGPYYLTGSAYIISWDIANYITSNECNRTLLNMGFEDKSIGNFIWNYSNQIQPLPKLQPLSTSSSLSSSSTGNMGIERPHHDQKEWMIHSIKHPQEYIKLWNILYSNHTISSY